METMPKPQLEALAADIAALLRCDAKFNPAPCDYLSTAVIQDDQGRGISFNAGREPGRLFIRGEMPGGHGTTFLPHGATIPRITVSLSKTTQQIARDIERRFLPDYLALWQQCQDRKTATESAYAKCWANAQRLAGTGAGVELRGDRRQYQEPGIHYYGMNQGRGYFDGQVHTDSVRLDIRSLSVELAEKVIRLIVAE